MELLGELDRIDTGHGNMRADTKDDQGPQQEEKPLLEIAIFTRFTEL
jgi:hypothetical protein